MITRTKSTWLSYGLLAFFGYHLVALGPLMNFISLEQGYTKTISGLHMSMYALGTVLSSLALPTIAKVLSRTTIMWIGVLGMGLGGLVLSLAQGPMMSFTAFFILGLMGSAMASMIQAILALIHGPNKTIALAEANVAASISQTLAPLLIGGLGFLGLDWRIVLYLGSLSAVVLFATMGRHTMDNSGHGTSTTTKSTSRLPKAFWASWVMLVAIVCIEWATTFWAVAFVSMRTGLDAKAAALGFTAYTGAFILGRVGGARLSVNIPLKKLVPLALVWCLVVFPLFWFATAPWLSLLALGLLGMGIANLYPLGMTLVLDSAPGNTDKASALTMLAVGLGILVSPLFLGWLGDRIPLATAFLMVPVFISLALFTFYVWFKISTSSTKQL